MLKVKVEVKVEVKVNRGVGAESGSGCRIGERVLKMEVDAE